MNTHQSRSADTNSLVAVVAMTVVTSIHHVYRLGLEVLVPALVLIALPVLLLRWQRRSGTRVALWAYAGLSLSIFSWFGFVDGFLDHVIKALGLQNTTFLPGGDAETVPTMFHLWSTQAGDLFYEGTGILTFALGLLAMRFTAAFVRDEPSPAFQPAPARPRTHPAGDGMKDQRPGNLPPPPAPASRPRPRQLEIS